MNCISAELYSTEKTERILSGCCRCDSGNGVYRGMYSASGLGSWGGGGEWVLFVPVCGGDSSGGDGSSDNGSLRQ
jgi:hypothetical protein